MSSSDATAAFSPMPVVDFGTCIQRAVRLYTSATGWFVVWGLAVAALQACLAVATAGWALLLGLMVLVPANIGLFAIVVAAARGETPTPATVLEGFRIPRAYALGLLETLLLCVGLVFFVVPGLIFAVATTWSAVALYRRNLGAWDAVTHSLALTRSHLGLTLLLLILTMGLQSLGTGTIVLGALTLPLAACLKVVLYEQIAPKG